jgi:osmoprotectant transport system ATP-binding protein
VSFEVGDGETCVPARPLWLRKTTTLRMINRLRCADLRARSSSRDATPGTVDPVELRRTIGYVIQQIGLFPNMTVAENIGVVPRPFLVGRRGSAAAPRSFWRCSRSTRAVPRSLPERAFGRAGAARRRRARARRRSAGAADGRAVRCARSGNREVIQDEFLRMQKTLRKTVLFVSTTSTKR